MKPLCIDLFCGLGGWAEGFLAEGYDCIGFDIERHDYGTGGYPGQLVIQDVLTLHGSQFKEAAVIVASPPCQAYSYMAMPWTRAKKMAEDIRNDYWKWYELTRLFVKCFEIALEAGIPLIVENVRGAIPWVGQSRWHYGSFHLWGDASALMPITNRVMKFNPDGTNHPRGSWFAVADSKERGTKSFAPLGVHYDELIRKQTEAGVGLKQGGEWWHDPKSITRTTWSTSPARKAASAQIAKIPFPLARHIARCFKPYVLREAGVCV